MNSHHTTIGLRAIIALSLGLLFLPMQAQHKKNKKTQVNTVVNIEKSDSIGTDTIALDSIALPWGERIKAELDALAREADRAYYNTGICVWDLTADSLLWGYNQHKVMRPASTQKTLTAISALDILGAQHELRTRAFYTGNISPDGTLQGDIYVVGDFDPLYSISDLKELAHAVRDKGILRIDGHIYADASMKNDDLYGNGWCWDDVPSKYEPYLCALMLERGKTHPTFTAYSKDAAFHPATHFAYVLSQELANLKIVDSNGGNVPYGQKDYPYNGQSIYTQTRTVEQVMQQMLKKSDNLHAEALFFQLAHLNKGRRCTWKDGARQVENVLRKAGASTSLVEVADGSGVSLYNYVSPETEVAMLRYAFRNKNIYNYFYPALPVAGVDGTLDSRMKSGPAFRNVHAKTGTLEGVIALCGYVTASNGHQLAFSILVNGVLTGKVARDYQDRICQELAR